MGSLSQPTQAVQCTPTAAGVLHSDHVQTRDTGEGRTNLPPNPEASGVSERNCHER